MFSQRQQNKSYKLHANVFECLHMVGFSVAFGNSIHYLLMYSFVYRGISQEEKPFKS